MQLKISDQPGIYTYILLFYLPKLGYDSRQTLYRCCVHE